MTSTTATQAALSWQQLQKLGEGKSLPDRVNGDTNSQATLRLFGQAESKVRVTLFRDHHAWCPYCQKVWMFLEEKQIPYRIKKVTMFCYGTKEAWYKKICPSGMLPAIQLDGQLITESDDILSALEQAFGPLYQPMSETRQVMPLRNLERHLFQAWCQWLCYPARSQAQERRSEAQFVQVAQLVDKALAATQGPYFLDQFSIVDCIFIPYTERMNASLFYYKGFLLRDPKVFPNIARWFDGMEARSTYRGTQSDFHTHCHDLPPQMGGCYENKTRLQQQCKARVDTGTDTELPDVGFKEPVGSTAEALLRCLKHRDNMMANMVRNTGLAPESVDQALRSALTYMMTGEAVTPPSHTDAALRYQRDRVNVPRDMSLWAARRFRISLEHTAALAGTASGPPLTLRHRRDQNPANFGKC